jgi:adenylate cyclase
MGRAEPARLLVLGTFRPSDADAGLRSAVGQVRRSGRSTELPLGRWSESDLRNYWERRDPVRPLSEGLVRLVHRRTDGNPLFVQTLLTAWSESAALVESDGEWRPKDDVEALAAEIPETLRALVDQRVEQLSPVDQRILEAGSVVGPTFAAALVATMLEMEEEEVDTRCHALARRGQMLRAAEAAEWPDGTRTTQFSFAHHLFSEALYKHMPLSRRTRLHLKVGERLEVAYGPEPAEQASALALHFRLGRDDARAIRYLRLSARQAARRSAHREAIVHLTSAIELTPRLPNPTEALGVELELQRMLGSALLLTRGWSDVGAERAYLRARTIAEQVDDPAQLARVLHGMAYLHEIRGDFHHSQSLLETCLRLSDRAPGPYTSLESHELLSCSLFHQGKFEKALRSARAAIEAFDPHSPGDAFVASLGMNAALAAHIWAGLALWCLGYPDQALEPLRGAIGIAGGSELIYMQAASHSQMAQLCQFRLELAPLTEHSEAALHISERQGYPFHYAVALTLRGWARVVEGGVDEGLEQIRRGLAMHEAAGAAIERPYGLGLLADALLRAGRRPEGLAVVDEALATIERRARAFFWEAELHRLRGELLVGEGAMDDAVASFQGALTVASRQGARSLELRAATSLCRLEHQLGTSNGGRERLRAVFDWFEEGRDTPDLRESAALLAVP